MKSYYINLKRSLILIVLSITFLISLNKVKVYAACNCIDEGACIESGGTCTSHYCEGIPGSCCCEFEGSFKNWSRFIWGSDEPPEEFKILGIEFETADLQRLVKTFLIVAISILVAGLGFVVAYGGVVWITAGDREEQLQKAKKIMKNGVIGIGIAFGFLAVLGVIAGILGVNIWNFSFLDSLV